MASCCMYFFVHGRLKDGFHMEAVSCSEALFCIKQ